jgi:hypothetical protein
LASLELENRGAYAEIQVYKLKESHMEMSKVTLSEAEVQERFNEIAVVATAEDILRGADVAVDEESTPATGKITAGETTREEAEELGRIAKEHMVAVDPNAPSCCIDGRLCVHTLSGQETESRASVAGGALVTAYAAMELLGLLGADDTTGPAARLGRVASVLRANGIVLGNHCDQNAAPLLIDLDAASADTLTGCGADDRLPEIMAKIFDEPIAIDAMVMPLMNGAFAPKLPYVARKNIEAQTAQWSPVDVVKTIDDQNAIEVLESPHEKPNHGHAEMGVLFNYVEGTTLDRDAFVAATGKQLFVVDMWYIDKLANALASGPDAAAQAAQLKQAMVAYQVATYLTLCDGSQWAMFAQPVATEENVSA